MTPWYAALLVLGLSAFAAGFWKGGAAERQGAAVLSGNLVLTIALQLSGSPHAVAFVAGTDGLTTLIFVWLALRRDRWWLLAATAGLVLCTATWVISLLHPAVGFYTAASAEIGEWALVYLALAAGVLERWLAGETPAGDAARRSRPPNP